MKRFLVVTPILAAVFMSCQQQTALVQQNILGGLELSLSSSGGSSARLTRGLQLQGTLREADVTFPMTPPPTVTVITDGAYDYLQAQFTVNNISGNTFDNLNLYAVAKNGNIGGSAIKTITDFGGVTSLEQARVAKLVAPTHGLQFTPLTGSSVTVPTLIAGREDFQVFDPSEVAALQNFTQAWTDNGFSSNDKVLGYGFVARRCIPNCANPTSFVRDIPTGQSGLINIALRIPKQGTATAYRFTMTFAVVNETTSRVTRSVYPPEALSAAEARMGTEIMQAGLTRSASQSSTKPNQGTDDVLVTNDATNGNASFNALGLGRLDLGINHGCALTASGVAYCWGANSNGKIGNPAATLTSGIPITVKDSSGADSALRFSSISAGRDHTCALTTDGTAYCWGDNSNGQGGNNLPLSSNPSPRLVDSTLKFSSISAGAFHTCAVQTDGTAYCWGLGSNGRLGNGTTTYKDVPTLVSGGFKFSSISAGKFHTCAVKTDGVAYCWGDNTDFQLGDFGPNQTLTPNLVKNDLGDPSALRFSSISAETEHTCGLTTAGVAYCWGDGAAGQLGTGGIFSFSPATVNDSFGNPNPLRFSSISAGVVHTCGLTTAGVAYCWGAGGAGRLGNTTIAQRNYPISVRDSSTNPSPLRFSSISTSDEFTCGVTTDGIVYCWGANGTEGKLGNNSSADSLVPSATPTLKF